MTINGALKIIIRQMEISNYRERTITDYKLHVKKFAEKMDLKYVSEISSENIYEWLHSMNVSAQTKLTRLKCLKAFLSKCKENNWIKVVFWRRINVKVDNKVKEGTKDRDINILLSLLDINDFVQLRTAVSAMLGYRCGLRMRSLALLEEKHIDFERKLLVLDGEIMKNHEDLLLPFDDELYELLLELIKQNNIIRREYKVKNNLIFITKKGLTTLSSPTNNILQKRLKIYSEMYELNNINGHALRRGFAKNLLNKGANIAVISKALGHQSLAVTTKYLHLDKDEVAQALREYL